MPKRRIISEGEDSDNESELLNDSVVIVTPETDDQATTSSNTKIPRSRESNSTSIIWKCYDAVGEKMMCKLCKKNIVKSKGGGTTNLLRHVRDKKDHELWYKSMLENTPSSVKSQKLIDGSLIKKSDCFIANIMPGQSDVENLLRFIIKDDQPYDIVESENFRALSDKPVAIKIAKTVKQKITALYIDLQEKMKIKLQDITSKKSFTMDIWTSSNNYCFLGVTIHFIDANWKLHSFLLDFVYLQGSHSGENMKNAFKEVLNKFGISKENVGGITLDNAASNITFIQALSDEDLFDSEWHIRCLCHVLNLAVKAYLEHMQYQITALRSGIRAIRASPQRLERLIELCNVLKINPLKPVLDVPTRWNSTYIMADIAQKLKPALNVLLAELSEQSSDESYILTSEELHLIQTMYTFLKPFYQATEIASTDKSVTVSCVIPLYNELLSHVEAHRTLSNEGVEHRALDSCYEKLNNYYDKTSHTLTIGTILDPRLNISFYNKDANIVGHESEESIKQIVKIAFDNGNYKESPIDSSGSANAAPLSQSNSNIRQKIFREAIVIEPKDELKIYYREALLDSEDNPLEYWAKNNKKFPVLSKMSRDYLPIQASSTSSERQFSVDKHVIGDTKYSLCPESITALMCLKNFV